MVAGGVSKCMKYTLFLFNFIFVVIGIVLIALGVSAHNGSVKYINLFDTAAFAAPPKLFIAIGVIMFLIAFLGCCGAVTENHSMVMAYSVFVGLILVLQLGVGIAAYLLEADVENVARTGLLNTVQQYNNETYPNFQDIRRSWDLIQHELNCCGVDNYTDWNNVPGPLINDTLVPSSCCLGGAFENCAKDITPLNINDTENAAKHIYTQGCLHKAVHDLAIGRMGYIGIGLSVVELLGVMCACFLARSIRFSYETV